MQTKSPKPGLSMSFESEGPILRQTTIANLELLVKRVMGVGGLPPRHSASQSLNYNVTVPLE